MLIKNGLKEKKMVYLELLNTLFYKKSKKKGVSGASKYTLL